MVVICPGHVEARYRSRTLEQRLQAISVAQELAEASVLGDDPDVNLVNGHVSSVAQVRCGSVTGVLDIAG